MSLFKRKEKKPQVTISPSCVYDCLKEKCPKWVVLTQNYEVNGKKETKQIGKCSEAWAVALLVEIRQTLEKLIPKK